MRILSALSIGILATATLAGGAMAGNNASTGFEKLKSLVGEWEAQTKDGKTHVFFYKLIADGSVIQEDYQVKGERGTSMVTMYHLDGDHLMLTHYCMAKNQPRLRADLSTGKTDVLTFSFLDATNLPDLNRGHMRKAVFKFHDKDQMIQEWTYRQNGKDSFTEVFQLKRTK